MFCLLRFDRSGVPVDCTKSARTLREEDEDRNGSLGESVHCGHEEYVY